MNNNNSNKRMEAEDHLLAQAQVLPLRSQIERGDETGSVGLPINYSSSKINYLFYWTFVTQ